MLYKRNTPEPVSPFFTARAHPTTPGTMDYGKHALEYLATWDGADDVWCAKRHAGERTWEQRMFDNDECDMPAAPSATDSTDTRQADETPLQRERSPTPPPVPPPSPLALPQEMWPFLPPLNPLDELPLAHPPTPVPDRPSTRILNLAARVPLPMVMARPLPKPIFRGRPHAKAMPMVARMPGVDVLGSWCLPTQPNVCVSFPSDIEDSPVEAVLSNCPFTKVQQEWFYIDNDTKLPATFVVPDALLCVKFSLGERLFVGPQTYRLLHMRIVFYDGLCEVAHVTIAPCGRDVRRYIFSMATRPNTNTMRLLVFYPRPRPGAKRTGGLPAGVIQRSVDITFQSKYAGASLMFRDQHLQKFVTVYDREA